MITWALVAGRVHRKERDRTPADGWFKNANYDGP